MYFRNFLILILFFSGAHESISAQINFFAAKTYPSSFSLDVITTGDVNNDGLDDIVAASGNDPIVYVWTQSQTGTLNNRYEYVYNSTTLFGLTSISIADINRDNLNDVVISYDREIGIFYQNTAGTLDSVYPLLVLGRNGFIESMYTSYLYSDSIPSIVFAGWASGVQKIKIITQTSSGFSIDSLVFSVPVGDTEVEIADMNRDSLPDLISGQLGKSAARSCAPYCLPKQFRNIQRRNTLLLSSVTLLVQ
jgi:hypothetical protein